jgi:glutamate carboxypeptidase
MLSPLRFSCALIGLAVIATTMAHPQATPATASLTPIEQRMAGNVDANGAADLALLEQLVATNSGTMHLAGVAAVKDILVPRFQKLGFRVKWVPMDTVTHRAGDLVAEHPCPAGEGHCGQRLLLVGHMDTVFEPSSPFQRYTIVPGSSGKIATGPGVADMKGGLVVMLAALRAMEFAEVLGNTEIRIVLSGDEERVGDPVDLARRDLVEAAKQSDVALEFEPSVRIDGQDSVSISRRSATTWQIEATGISGHSSQIFGDRLGYGAIYELNRILDTFRRDLPEDGLTYSVGLMLGGGTAQLNPDQTGGTATGKDNVVAATALAVGDLRTESNEQTQRVETKMRSIVEQHLPKTGATITFGDSYPAMATTPASEQLFRAWNEASESLALGPVQLGGPMSRGAGDIAFAAPYVPGLVGVGILGEGYHAVGETAFLDSLSKQAKRNAVLMERLVRQPAKH